MTAAERKSGGGGGLRNIRSLIRRRPASDPRDRADAGAAKDGGGVNTNGASRAPMRQQPPLGSQSQQRRRVLPAGSDRGGQSSSLPTSRKRPAGPVASSAPPYEHLRRSRPPPNRRMEFGSESHLGIGARPRSGSESQPRGGAAAGRSTVGGGCQSRQPRPQPSRQKRSRQGGSRASKDVSIGGGGGRGNNQPAAGRPRVPSLRERGQRPNPPPAARPQCHDPAALQRMREESRRQMGFTSTSTTTHKPLRGESQRKFSGSIVVSRPPTGNGTNRRRRSKTLGEDNRTPSSNSKLSTVSTVVSEVSASKAQPTQVETVRQQSLRSAHLMPTISSAKLHVVSEVDSPREKSAASAAQSASQAATNPRASNIATGTDTQQVCDEIRQE